MKRFSLSPHPTDAWPKGNTIEVGVDVAVKREPTDELDLHFRVTGDIGALLVPPRAPAERVDELRRHTCFEAFVRASGDDGYLELNFSPSTAWAAYRFSGRRRGMTEALECPAPAIRFDLGETAADLRVGLPLAWESRLRDADWRLGLAAILEDRSGRPSHWAIVHPAGRPDFHHADGFPVELPRG